MCYFYILECKLNNKIIYYKGITNDVIRRLNEHKSGKRGYTKRFKGKVELVYTEWYLNRSLARQREIEVKKFYKQQVIELIFT